METIDERYFKELTSISNLDTKYADIQDEIVTYSKAILIDVLGYDLYKQLIAANPSDNSTDLGKIYYGTEFEVDGKTELWNGFINSDMVSILSDYTFIKYSESQYVLNGMHGTTIPNPENSVMQGSDNRLVKVGQRMECMIQDLYDYMYYSELYTDIIGIGCTPYTFKRPNSFQV